MRLARTLPLVLPILIVLPTLAVLATHARAATPVRPPAAVVVAIQADRCPAPDPARFLADVAATTTGGWWLAGAAHVEWSVFVDAERAAAMGVTTQAQRELFTNRVATFEGDPDDLGKVLLAGAATPRGGTGLPASAFTTVEAKTVRDLHVTLDGTPVVAAVTESRADPVAVAAVGAALARACGTPLDAVDVAVIDAQAVRWRVSYRTALADDEARWTRARMLEGALAATRGGGRTLGWHVGQGGGVWGFARGGADPEIPPSESLKTPDFHALVQRSRRGVWRHPLQAVVRIVGAGDRADEVYAAAKHVADAVGPRVNVLVSTPQTPLAFAAGEKGKALAKARLGDDDVDFVLRGLSLRTPAGATVHVTLSPGAPRGDVRLVGRGGSVHTLGSLGALEERPDRTATLRSDGSAYVFLSMPTDATFAVAKALSEAPIPAAFQVTVHNWNVLGEDDAIRILDWWAGL